MNKKLIFVCLSLFALQLTSAELLINPSTLDVTVESGEQKVINLELKNTFNFGLFDFEFTNLDDFSIPDFTLQPNETKTIPITVNGDTVRVETITSEISFKYLVDLPEEPQVYKINITNNGGFNPEFITIREGDTIEWFNEDTITRTVTGSLFDEDISPNETFSYIFQDAGQYTYQDLTLFVGGVITVINETQGEEVNNPTFNKNLIINLEVTLDPTTIEFTLNTLEFTIEATDEKESLMTIKNTGSILAQSIKLSSEPNWVVFDENNFDLNPGEENFVTFKVAPLVFNANETNKDYNITINAKGSNTPNIQSSIKLFIPFSQSLEDATTNEGFLSYFLRYCEQNPNLIICNNTISSGNGNSGLEDITIDANISKRELLQTLRDVRTIKDTLERSENDRKVGDSLLNDQLPKLNDKVDGLLNKTNEIEEVDTARTRAFWWIVFFSVLVGCILVGGFATKHYLTKKDMVTISYT